MSLRFYKPQRCVAKGGFSGLDSRVSRNAGAIEVRLTMEARAYRVRTLLRSFSTDGWVRTPDGACGVGSRKAPKTFLPACRFSLNTRGNFAQNLSRC